MQWRRVQFLHSTQTNATKLPTPFKSQKIENFTHPESSSMAFIRVFSPPSPPPPFPPLNPSLLNHPTKKFVNPNKTLKKNHKSYSPCRLWNSVICIHLNFLTSSFAYHCTSEWSDLWCIFFLWGLPERILQWCPRGGWNSGTGMRHRRGWSTELKPI